MAIVVEPTVSKEKLVELLSECAEQGCLDYKRSLNLGKGNQRDVVDLAKDVAALQSEPKGGYIVIGADDYGTTVPDLTYDLARHFDEATVGRKLAKYLAEPEVRIGQHEINGHTVVLLYILPSEFGWCIFREAGEYEEPQVNGKSRRETVFRVGDVFVRHGSRSERWTDADCNRLVSQVIARRKDAWRREMAAEWDARFDLSLTAHRLEAMPTAAVTWRLDVAAFDQLVTELLRRGDDIPLMHLLEQAPRDASALLALGNDDELQQLLDRLTSMAALAIRYERQGWLERVVVALEWIYGLGFDEEVLVKRNKKQTASLWLDITARVSALGALAVRRKAWATIHLLAARTSDQDDVVMVNSGTWLRHAVTMAHRAGIVGPRENQTGLLARAHNVIREIDGLHPDVAAEDERILNSLCQFDFYACLVSIAQYGLKARKYYPNFSRYYAQRVTPAARAMITDLEARRQLFGDDERQLAEALRVLNQQARTEGFNFGEWDGYEDRRVDVWIAEHSAGPS